MTTTTSYQGKARQGKARRGADLLLLLYDKYESGGARAAFRRLLHYVVKREKARCEAATIQSIQYTTLKSNRKNNTRNGCISTT